MKKINLDNPTNSVKKQRKSTTANKIQLGWHRHPFAVPVMVFVVLSIFSLITLIATSGSTLGAADTRVVYLSVDGQQQSIPTRAKTVDQLLKNAEITLGSNDIVEPSLATEIQEDDFRINIYRARRVLITDGSTTVVVDDANPSLRKVAQSAGFDVYDEDFVEIDTDTLIDPVDVLEAGGISKRVVIERSVPVILNLYGVNYDIRTHAKTVADLMQEREIAYADESVFPRPEEQLRPEMAIFVTDSQKQIDVVEEVIASPQEFIDDFDLLLGRTVIQQEGIPGKRVVVYEINADGSRSVLQQVIVKQPTPSVVARGKKPPVVAGNKVEIMRAAGIPESEMYAADFIIGYESGWRVNAMNASGCAGLGQSCPGSKLAAVCPNWETDPVCQMQFFNGYAVGRYGSWSRAFEVWQMQRWW
jgi:uncharacterized protein YabE (DUF348 family)